MPRPPERRGVSIVEVLLSLSIFALLLGSVAAAIQASSTTYSENDKTAVLTQMARTVLDRMAKQARSAADINSDATSITIYSDSAHLNGTKYVVANQQLSYVSITGGVQTTETLLGAGDDTAVTGFSVVRQENAIPKTVAVSVTIELTYSGRKLSLTSSAVVRANKDW